MVRCIFLYNDLMDAESKVLRNTSHNISTSVDAEAELSDLDYTLSSESFSLGLVICLELLGSSAKQRNILVYFAGSFQISTVALRNKSCSYNRLIAPVVTETAPETDVLEYHALAVP